MSDNNETRSRNLIEAAMERLARDAPSRPATAAPLAAAPAAASTDALAEPKLGRRQYDQVLLHRHAPPRPASADEVPAALEPPPHAEAPPLASSGVRTYRGETVLLVGVVAALGAAVLTWLAISDADLDDMAAPARPAAVAPAAAPPPAAEVEVAAPAALPVDVGEAQARDLVERWRQAWASRDVDGYLACYGAGFLPADGKTRPAWEAARREKLSSQSDISVQLRDLRVERVGDDQVKAVFLQDYASDTYRESARPKTLLLERTGGDWRIAGEWQGGAPSARAGK